MTQPLLSIQLPYTAERLEDVGKLTNELCRQIKEYNLTDLIVFDIDDRGKEISIGEKRNDLYKRAGGIYCVQWDSDDWIAEDGLFEIIKAIQLIKNVDCVVYQEKCVINGEYFKSNHSILYNDWEGDGSKLLSDGFHYHRTPFFKSVIRTDLVQKVEVPRIRWGEDHEWAKALKPLLHTQTGIDKEIYHYIHNSTNPTERYGLDKD